MQHCNVLWRVHISYGVRRLRARPAKNLSSLLKIKQWIKSWLLWTSVQYRWGKRKWFHFLNSSKMSRGEVTMKEPRERPMCYLTKPSSNPFSQLFNFNKTLYLYKGAYCISVILDDSLRSLCHCTRILGCRTFCFCTEILHRIFCYMDRTCSNWTSSRLLSLWKKDMI